MAHSTPVRCYISSFAQCSICERHCCRGKDRPCRRFQSLPWSLLRRTRTFLRWKSSPRFGKLGCRGIYTLQRRLPNMAVVRFGLPQSRSHADLTKPASNSLWPWTHIHPRIQDDHPPWWFYQFNLLALSSYLHTSCIACPSSAAYS